MVIVDEEGYLWAKYRVDLSDTQSVTGLAGLAQLGVCHYLETRASTNSREYCPTLKVDETALDRIMVGDHTRHLSSSIITPVPFA